MSDLPRANWFDRVSFSTSWRTARSFSMPTAKPERISLLSAPFHNCGFASTPIERAELGKLFNTGLASCAGYFDAPIPCDATRTTASVFSSVVLPCDTRWRRFQVGRACYSITNLRQFQKHTIVALSESSITVAVATTLPLGTEILPTFVASPIEETEAELFSDYFGNSRVQYEEAETGEVIAATNSYGGSAVPELVLRPNWAERPTISFASEGDTDGQGKGTIPVRVGTPYRIFSFKITEATRESYWPILQHFDGCRGAARSFDFESPASPWIFSILSPTTIQCSNEKAWQVVRKIRARSIGGQQSVAVSSVAGAVATLASPISGGILSHNTEIVEMLRCTHASDTLEETWFSTEVVESRLSVREEIE